MLASDFWSVSFLRFATGLGLGVLLPLGTTYINELAPHRVATRSRSGASRWDGRWAASAGIVGVFLTPTWLADTLLCRLAFDPANYRASLHSA